jgi:Transposase IS66 family
MGTAAGAIFTAPGRAGCRRRCGRAIPPAALFFYSPDRKGEHPQAHLKEFRGVIHADGYAGFNELFVGGRILEAGCWAHVRRKFFDVHAATGSPIAKPNFRSFDLNDIDYQWLASHLAS